MAGLGEELGAMVVGERRTTGVWAEPGGACRAELTDLASKYPEIVADLSPAYVDWAARCGVIPPEKILGLKK